MRVYGHVVLPTVTINVLYGAVAEALQEQLKPMGLWPRHCKRSWGQWGCGRGIAKAAKANVAVAKALQEQLGPMGPWPRHCKGS